MAKIEVDKNLCIGCGTCVSECPDCFELDDEGKSHPKECDQSCCDLKSVADDCPVAAITVIC